MVDLLGDLRPRCRRILINAPQFLPRLPVPDGEPDKLPITEDTPQSPINPYGQTKLDMEFTLKNYARAYGLSFAAFRYFNAAGAAAGGEIGEHHDPETHLIP